jgi:succinate-semialdehyde dehydrogenase / glutarate-semialdehyde dehydrogenase
MKIKSIDPSNYEVVGEVEASSEQEIQEVVEKARKVQPKWAALSQAERNKAVQSFADVLVKHDDELAAAVSTEMGKPINISKGDIQQSADYFKAFMEMAERALEPITVFEDDTQKHIQIREPLGVLVVITPWNFPIFNIPFQFGQALLAGNAILYKPSEEIIVFAQLIQKLIKESDLPDGVFNVIFGDGKVGEQLVQLPVDGILFTGSSKTGQRITELASKKSTPVMTEMGGSSPGIIFEDADVDKIIDTVYDMRMANSGQYCDGLKRLLVHESKLDQVIGALKKVNATKKVGNAMDRDTNFGPLVAKRQLDLLQEQVKDALDKGAEVVFGGKKPVGLDGAYYEPTLLANINSDMRVWKEEVFGPVLPIVTFKNEEEAIALANDTQYGLSAFVFTSSKDRFDRVAGKLQAGAIGHNNALYFSPYSPFGGFKKSGNSRVCGIEGFHEVTQLKLVSAEK